MEKFPNPEELKKYGEINPNLVDYFKEMQRTIINDASKLKNREVGNERLKIVFALLSVLLIAGLSAYAFYLGYPNQAASITISVTIGLAGIFITGRFIKKE